MRQKYLLSVFEDDKCVSTKKYTRKADICADCNIDVYMVDRLIKIHHDGFEQKRKHHHTQHIINKYRITIL